MAKPFYLTTPLYYVNDVPHVGHTYTTLIGDAIARYKRLQGFDVCYLTGTDEHGQKIERAATQRKIKPQKLVDQNARAFRDAWKKLGVEFDEFIRTSQPRHYRAVSEVYRLIEENGYIYLGEYKGQYCVRDEAFVASGEKICPECGGPTEFISEESYFFKLSDFQQKLLDFYEDNPDFVVPKTRMNEVVSFVKGGLRDFSISRTSFSWGIPVPDHENHIFYVWFDALNGYISGIGFGEDEKRFERYWPAGVQLMGKDILRFHAVYWPALLLAAGLEPPHQLLVHGWWTINGQKMSKSLGNFVTAETLIQALPNDYIRYFLMREITLGSDGNFSYDALLTRINSDLANDLGNLASRILKMIDNYFDGQIPEPGARENADEQLLHFTKETVKLYQENFDKLQLNKALENVWELISVANKYIVANEPWALARDPAKRDRLGTVLYCSAEALRITAVLLSPVIPQGTEQILHQLGVSADELSTSDFNWGSLKAGSPIGKVEPVYPRLEQKELVEALEPPSQKSAPKESRASQEEEVETISIEEFSKVEMRVGKILEAERVAKSDKLVKLKVDIGSEERQVVAGIGKEYDPQSLPGRLVVVVTNLKPARLMGVESNGMIVAASEDGRPVLTTFTEPVKVGSRLR